MTVFSEKLCSQENVRLIRIQLSGIKKKVKTEIVNQTFSSIFCRFSAKQMKVSFFIHLQKTKILAAVFHIFFTYNGNLCFVVRKTRFDNPIEHLCEFWGTHKKRITKLNENKNHYFLLTHNYAFNQTHSPLWIFDVWKTKYENPIEHLYEFLGTTKKGSLNSVRLQTPIFYNLINAFNPTDSLVLWSSFSFKAGKFRIISRSDWTF